MLQHSARYFFWILNCIFFSYAQTDDGPSVGDNAISITLEENMCKSIQILRLSIACDEMKKWNHPGIDRQQMVEKYINSVPEHDNEWCSSFVNWVVSKAGEHSSNSNLASSWLDVGTLSTEPEVGAIVIYDWNQPDAPLLSNNNGKHNKVESSSGDHSSHGHAGIIISLGTKGEFFVIGGNQKCRGEAAMICIKKYSSTSSQSKDSGFRRPEKV
jgi:hypothetical protein